mmetsp:Transcript_39763/g.69849  ORF Transcript_39763/g.69849 Transcript_39763/m.69849 type:complete len:339 (-) Transcript_39763:138-1154(-)
MFAWLLLFTPLVYCVAKPDAVTKPDADMFKVIYYINLDSAIERRQHMSASLRQTGMPAQRFAAVDAAEVASGVFDDEFVKRQGMVPRMMDLSEDARHHVVGCFLSHVKALQKAQAQLKPDELALIMEDDVAVPSDWKYMMHVALTDAPEDWSLLKVSGWGAARDADKTESTSFMPLTQRRSHVLWNFINFITGRPGVTYWQLHEPFIEYDSLLGKQIYYGGTGGYIVRGSSVSHVLDHLLSRPIDDLDSMLLLPPGSRTQFYEGWPHVLNLTEDHHDAKNAWHTQAPHVGTPSESASLIADAKANGQVHLHSASRAGHLLNAGYASRKLVRKGASHSE